MPQFTLTLIGESINDSVPSTRRLFESGEVAGLQELARSQDAGGADYIDVNVGARPASFLADMVRAVQAVTTKPLSIDTPDPAMAEAALKAYDIARAGGRMPILNSVSPLRLGMLDLRKIVAFKPILLVSERLESGSARPNRTANETYQTARQMLAEVTRRGIPVADCLIDPAISPIATDTEGHLPRVLNTLRRIHDDPAFTGVHASVGLSNFTVMLPATRKDGSPTRNPLENAFLTRATPLGLDFVIGSVKRNYEVLPPNHPALLCLDDCTGLEGLDAIMRVREFYAA
jgi:5-methyltetrahydrofolate corrinoid/iron sulfur protein methyltransferase